MEAPAVAEEIEAAQIGAAPTEEHPTGDQGLIYLNLRILNESCRSVD